MRISDGVRKQVEMMVLAASGMEKYAVKEATTLRAKCF